MSILDEIRIHSANVQKKGSDHEHLNRMVAWYSKRLTGQFQEAEDESDAESRVALLDPILRAYLSLCRNCKNCEYDCSSVKGYTPAVIEASNIRGPCMPVDITKIAKEFFTYEQETG